MPMTSQPILTTKRLILRPFEITDAKRVQQLASEKEIARTTLMLPYPYEDGMAESWIGSHAEKYASNEETVFAVVLKEEAAVIGAVGLARSKISPHAAEMGYWIGLPYWNNGYCTEAARAVLSFGFESFELTRIAAHHFGSNPSSGRVMANIGMKQEGRLRAQIIKWGNVEDLVLYGILKEEFRLSCPDKSN
jgi:RimJ/RimL family protein N-acetyltransferase